MLLAIEILQEFFIKKALLFAIFSDEVIISAYNFCKLIALSFSEILSILNALVLFSGDESPTISR